MSLACANSFSNYRNLQLKLFNIWWVCLLLLPSSVQAELVQSELYKFEVQTLADDLERPWSLAFLPDNKILVSEKPGRLRLISGGKLVDQPIAGLPSIRQHGQGGLMDIAVHPDFVNNRFIYLAYCGRTLRGYGTEVLRGRLIDRELIEVKTIFKALPKSRGGRHFGGRLLFSEDGKLFITLGDRGDRPRAQNLNDHAGSLIRLNDDGSVPEDNPFIKIQNAQPEIYSYGHRNIQGISLGPQGKVVWTHEHGPQGGDEINIIQAGLNYGWPTITYGVNYGTGTKIGEGTHKAGLEQPLYFWDPSIAPSGMTFYSGKIFPKWQDNLFVGSLKFGLLVRLVIENNKVVHEERMLDKQYGRIRDVRQGPEGTLYLLTDETPGKVLKLHKVAD